MDDIDDVLDLRWDRYGTELVAALQRVYPNHDRLAVRVRKLIREALASRPATLRRLDEARLLRPDWLQQPGTAGYVCCVDRFAGTLNGVAERLDHLQELGVTYLHLMPLLQPRPGPNDGGHAVADHRAVRSDLGTMADLAGLAAELRGRGMSLVVDLVLNHVAREHEWAERARVGEQRYRDYFLIHPDRTLPDEYERTLPAVFPDFAPGNVTWDDEVQGWVWTTSNDYQWDLNWANPDVFCEFVGIILNLANHGVEVLRLDSIAFIWKVMGTDCRSEPQGHDITAALRAVLRIAAPACAFKAEAIVGPRDLIAYFGEGRNHGRLSDLAYHNSLMAQLWSALASRDVTLLRQALDGFPPKPANATWGTYVRCHDDIGWVVDDRDAVMVGLDGAAHRRFLSDFYSGEFPGSFARGLVFQADPATGDRHISGTLASLAGLERALAEGQEPEIELAVRRINLLHTVICGFGGIPLIHMGDEIGMLNDHGYAETPDHADDNRWVHRPVMDWARVAELGRRPHSPAARIHTWLCHVLGVRRHTPHLHASVESTTLDVGDRRVLALGRSHPVGPMIQLYNLSEERVTLPMQVLRDRFGRTARELLDDVDWDLSPDELELPSYAVKWFIAGRDL